MQLPASLKYAIPGVAILLIVTLSSLYALERKDRQAAELERDNVTNERDALQLTIDKQKERIESFNALGVTHEEELSSAKKEIDRLSDQLSSGPKRVYVKAECPTSVPSTTSSGSVEHDSAARLSESAREDYLRLRRMMVEARQQTLYLQDYIRQQCLR